MLILDAQVARALSLKLDDFTTFMQDSTHVAGNTKWPTDSRLMATGVERLLRVGSALSRFSLPVVGSEDARSALKVMVRLDREIDMSRGKKESERDRRRRYEKLLKKAKRVHKLLAAQAAPLFDILAALDMRPSQKALAARAVERLHADLDTLAQVISACEARVLRDEKLPMSEKILSCPTPTRASFPRGSASLSLATSHRSPAAVRDSSPAYPSPKAMLQTRGNSCQWSTRSSSAPTWSLPF